MGEKVKLKQTFKRKWEGRKRSSIEISVATELANGQCSTKLPLLCSPCCPLCAVTDSAFADAEAGIWLPCFHMLLLVSASAWGQLDLSEVWCTSMVPTSLLQERYSTLCPEASWCLVVAARAHARWAFAFWDPHKVALLQKQDSDAKVECL